MLQLACGEQSDRTNSSYELPASFGITVSRNIPLDDCLCKMIFWRFIITTTTTSRQNEDAGCSISLVNPGCIFDLKAPGGQPSDRADSSVARRPSKTSGTVSGFSMQSMLCQAVAALSSHDAAQLTYISQLSSVAISDILNSCPTGLCRITIYRAAFQSASTERALHSSE